MKLLIVTQAVDKHHPILGFFHRWIEEFAVHCETVSVICLQAGDYSFPKNVHVYSLGKEEGKGRLTNLYRFYKYIWMLRHEYDQVFVHMNQQYVILGAPIWRTLKKKVGLWYMHGAVSLSLKIAEMLTDRIFTGSPESFRLKSNKVVVTGHGIDTTHFAPQPVEKITDLITVGRITESKNLETLVDILKVLRKTHPVTLTIVGKPVTQGERDYEDSLKKKITQMGLDEAVIFKGAVTQKDLPRILNQSKVFVTAAQNGSLDKAVLEAMACGLPIVSMAPGTASLPLAEAQVATVEVFVEKTKQAFAVSSVQEGGVIYLKQEHSIGALIPKILYG